MAAPDDRFRRRRRSVTALLDAAPVPARLALRDPIAAADAPRAFPPGAAALDRCDGTADSVATTPTPSEAPIEVLTGH